MKKLQLFTFLILLISHFNLTFGQAQKASIDTKVVSEIIQTKIKESTVRGIYTAAEKYFGNDANFLRDEASKKFVYNTLDLLFKEKNKKTLQNKLLAEVLDYSIYLSKGTNLGGYNLKDKEYLSYDKVWESNIDKSLFLKFNSNFIEEKSPSSNFSNSGCVEQELNDIIFRLRNNKIVPLDIAKANCIIDIVINALGKITVDVPNPNLVLKPTLPTVLLSILKDNLIQEGDENNIKISMDPEGILGSVFERFSGYTINNSMASNWYFLNPRPFFQIGINQVRFLDGNNTVNPSSDKLYYLTLFSEKIGFQFKICDFKYARSFKKGESFRYRGRNYVRLTEPKDPFISNIYWSIYGSGIMYNIFNSTTKSSFNAPLFGIGTGVTLYNGLNLNFSIGTALDGSKKGFDSKNTFVSVGLDIPLIEYLKSIND